VKEGSSWVDSKPDVILFFTDGVPTVFSKSATGTCNWNCNWARQRADGSGLLDGCNGGSTGAACFWADRIRSDGIKIFLVGIGGAADVDAIFNIKLVSGPNRWDTQPSTFYNADYISNSDFGALGTIFVQVVRGLCTCLQTTPSCSGTQVQCAATQWSARLRVTTTALSSSSTFARGAVQAAYLYYNFVPSPNTRIQYQFFDPSQTVDAASPTIVRTDLQDPCSIQRQVTCGGICYSVSERQDLPRFFREASDTLGFAGSYNRRPTQCNGPGYTKNYTAIGQTPSQASIKYLWMQSDDVTPCAAEAFDQTLYEFFTLGSGNTGVFGLGQTPRVLPALTQDVTFTLSRTCSTARCGRDVLLVMLVDEQIAVSPTDFSNSLNFLSYLVGTFNVSSDLTRFGLIWSNPTNTPAAQDPTIPQTGTTLQTNFLATSPFLKHPQAKHATTDYAARVEVALTRFFSGPPNPLQKREILTMVLGPDDPAAAAARPNRYTALQQLFVQYQVEAFALGVGPGSYDVQLLANLSSPSTDFLHFQSFTSSTFLADNQAQFSPIFCPQGNLCGAGCSGFCGCASVDTCACPTCRNSACFSRNCTNPGVGCVVSSTRGCDDGKGLCTFKQCVEPDTGCTFPVNVTCNDNNNCTEDSCGLDGVCSYTDVDVDDGKPCTLDQCLPSGQITHTLVTCPQNNSCFSYACTGQNGPTCTVFPRICVDSNPCTVDGVCDNNTGCVFNQVPSPQAAGCTAPACQIATCLVSNSACGTTPNMTAACACVNFPCTNNSYCVTQECINTATRCQQLPFPLNVTCLSSLSGTPARYCYDAPSSASQACTGLSDRCTTRTCVNNVSNSSLGSCSSAPSGLVCSPQNQCFNVSCHPVNGCVQTKFDAAYIAANICNDGSRCTADTCTDAGVCVFSDISSSCNPPTPDKCRIFECNSTTGCVSRARSVAAAGCDDGNFCTTDSCLNNQCFNVPGAVTCPPNDQCSNYSCVNSTGACLKTDRVCNDNNPCTRDTCNGTVSGGCVFTLLTNQTDINAACTPSFCQTAACSLAGCVMSPVSPLPPACNSDPCISNPCASSLNTFCRQAVCINNLTSASGGYSCDSVTNATEKAICQNFVTNGDASIGGKKRYCFVTDRVGVCETNNRCYNFTCNDAASRCDVLNTGASCNLANRCQLNACNNQTGCITTPKSALANELQCTDDNACKKEKKKKKKKKKKKNKKRQYFLFC
jgi:hypothetical protein